MRLTLEGSLNKGKWEQFSDCSYFLFFLLVSVMVDFSQGEGGAVSIIGHLAHFLLS